MTRHLHYTEALQETRARGEIIVQAGDVLVQGRGYQFVMVAACGKTPEDAELVLLLPPRGYGCWSGQTVPGLRYIGWIEELTDDELDRMSDEEAANAPDCCHAYAVDASAWRKFDQPWWDWFRQSRV
ncbi:hypothetical protein [Nocardia niwae]|uniref:hypothetical protein n=1 Tax=Nocardia niwae TaxID=626084 RepID=UPI000A52FD9A|nr:hypothetical protein [Nocardia niwae]